MNYIQFRDKSIGKTVGYPNSEYMGECLSLVKRYITDVFGVFAPASGNGSASGYWLNFPSPLPSIFERVKNEASNVPKQGDIMLWLAYSGNQYGHISIIDSADSMSFTSLDQNWNGKAAKLVKHNYTNPAVIGWLTPKDPNINNDTKEDMSKLLTYLGADDENGAISRLREHLGEHDSKCDWGNESKERGGYLGSARREISDLKPKIKSLDTTNASLNTQITSLKAQIEALKQPLITEIDINALKGEANGLSAHTDLTGKVISYSVNFKVKGK